MGVRNRVSTRAEQTTRPVELGDLTELNRPLARTNFSLRFRDPSSSISSLKEQVAKSLIGGAIFNAPTYINIYRYTPTSWVLKPVFVWPDEVEPHANPCRAEHGAFFFKEISIEKIGNSSRFATRTYRRIVGFDERNSTVRDCTRRSGLQLISKKSGVQ